jgi:hypothetical protein
MSDIRDEGTPTPDELAEAAIAVIKTFGGDADEATVVQELFSLYGSSFESVYGRRQVSPGLPRWEADVLAALALAVDRGKLVRDDDGRYRLTGAAIE